MSANRRGSHAGARFTQATRKVAVIAVCGALVALAVLAFAGYLTSSALLALLSGLTFCG